jgi:hypothetical protein
LLPRIWGKKMIEWRSVEEFDGYYEISSNGEVKSLGRWVKGKGNSQQWRDGRILTPIKDTKNGYFQVGLCIDRKISTRFVHRLLGIAFIPNPLNLPQINHKDGNKNNNDLNNLEWCTHQENIKHSRDVLKKCIGEDNGNAKLTNEQVKEIRKIEGTLKYKANKYNVSISCIHRVMTGEVYPNV